MHHDDETLRAVASRYKRRREAFGRSLIVDVDAAVPDPGLALDAIGLGGEGRGVGAVDPVHDQVVEIVHQVEPPVDQRAAPAKWNHLLGGTLIDRAHQANRPEPWIHGSERV